MVKLNKIYTRTGDDGTSGLVDGSRGNKAGPRFEAIGSVDELNSAIGLSILGGEPGPARDVVLLNAGAALFVAGRAADVGEGIEIAAASIDSGAAAERVTVSASFVDG